MEKNIDIDELMNLQKEGAIIVDVRSPQEYREGHIPNSLSIPDYEIQEKAGIFLDDKSKEIVLYCGVGTRSKHAKEILEGLGYTNVYNLHNGLENYCDFNFYMIK